MAHFGHAMRIRCGAGMAGLALAILLGAPPSGRTPLDLPTALACTPELSFFGATLEGDSFVWCIDRSSSMSWGNLIGEVKAEVTSELAQLSPAQRFSIVAYGAGYITLSPVLLPATSGNVSTAQGWVTALVAEGATALAPAGVFAIGMLNSSGIGSRSLLVIGDGPPNSPGPEETLAAMTVANYQMIPIHTVQVGSSSGDSSFFENLAAANGGTFHWADAPPTATIRRGDVDGDGLVVIGDAIRILRYGFGVDCSPICRDAADATDDGIFEPISDAVTLLGALFVAGHPPLAEPAACGDDPTADGLPCAVTACP